MNNKVALNPGWLWMAWALLGVSSPVLAESVLRRIPSNAATVVVIPDPAGLAAKLDRLSAELNAQRPASSREDALGRFGLPAGLADTAKPAAIVFLRSGFDDVEPVYVFRPVDPARWQPVATTQPADQPPSLVRTVAIDAKRRLMAREIDGWVFAGNSRRDVLRATRIRGGALSDALNSSENELLLQSDIFLRISGEAWNTSLRQGLAFVRLAMSGASALSGGSQAGRTDVAFTDYLLTGLTRVFDEMSSTCVGIALEDDGVRLAHDHTFAPNGSVSKYLGDVKRSELDVWARMPNEPFMLAFGYEWRSPADSSLGDALLERVFALPGVREAVPESERQEIRDLNRSIYARLLGGMMVLRVKADSNLDIQGAHFVQNAPEAEKALVELLEKSKHAAGALLPGFEGFGKPVTRKIGDLAVHEMSFDAGGLQADVREAFKTVYGSNARYLLAAVDDSAVCYGMGVDDADFSRLAATVRDKKNGMASNARVKAMLAALPKGPNAAFLVDIERITRMASRFTGSGVAKMSVQDESGVRHPVRIEPSGMTASEGVGPLLGWAVVVRPDGVRGEFFMTRNDIKQAVRLFKEYAQTAAQKSTGRAVGTETKTRAPNQR